LNIKIHHLNNNNGNISSVKSPRKHETKKEVSVKEITSPHNNILTIPTTMNNTDFNNFTLQNSDSIEAALLELKKELQNLKTDQNHKNETIKNLTEKVKSLENENKNLLKKLQENLDKYNTEITQRGEDLEFLKRAYEDQKNKLSREHDMLSSSMYEMVVQFMTIKNEMNKRTSPKRVEINNSKKLNLNK
jgi:chromosome segregation ATPase